MAPLDNQPTRGLYAVGAGLGTLAFLPWYLLKNLVPTARSHESWTYHQAVASSVVRSFLWHQANMRIRTPLSLEPGSLGDRLEIIQPAPETNYTGVLTSKVEIQPIAIPGVWYPNANSRATSKDHPVILHIHGGCFVTLDARPADSGFAAKVLGKISPRVLFVSYRLSSNPGGQFPAALQDALTAYLFLVNREGSSKNIILSGDSAGANIVLGLLRYINNEGKTLGLQQPKAALLWSPWLDIASVHKNPEVIDNHPNAALDFMNSRMAGWGASVVGNAEDVESPYLTSIGHPFAIPDTALWYQAGDAEIWYDEAVKSSEEMKSISGNKVSLHVEIGATHDILLAGEVTGFASNAMRSAEKAKDFLGIPTSASVSP